MHVIFIIAAVAVVCAGPFMSGPVNNDDDAAYLDEQQAERGDIPVDEDSSENGSSIG